VIPLHVPFVNKRSASRRTKNVPVVFVVDIVVSVPTVLSIGVVTRIDSPEVPADALAAGVVVPVVLLVAVGDSVVNVVGVVVLPESTSRCAHHIVSTAECLSKQDSLWETAQCSVFCLHPLTLRLLLFYIA